ncbi:hypothetical protein [Steroidobacter agaridevorans]|uniref:hypothetical protein n=1 Tax=Steroidobacter agaridevorans TaxID=2695856 RepID=UPI0013266E38|nr:hypothetical protein [Steroidobacter agaridevorans]GFE85174.1 hypothetical protein GCM10011488_01280 [Steroidobacter agaridevorans]
MAISRILVALGLTCATHPSFAWVYPEHRDIAVLSIESLDPERKALFDQLWAEARTGHEKRLCEQGADTAQGVTPECIDWAAMSAIGGDHSCSSQQLLDTVISSKWILAVAEVAARLKVDLMQISKTLPVTPQQESGRLISELRQQLESEAIRADRSNALRIADMRIQRADSEYAIRAGSNNAHFLLARPRVDFTAQEYIDTTLRSGSEISAVGVWGRFHLSALQKATRLAQENLSPDERSTLARATLADEAFALHFLQDVFAAGHVAGTWGDVSQRRGTHDHYNESGLEVRTWQAGATTAVLMGDAHMRPEDAMRAAEAVRLSLEQVLDTAAGRQRTTNLPYTPTAPNEPETFDVCENTQLEPMSQGREPTPEALQLGVEVLMLTPVPSLGEGLGAMPRFRAELGPFLGVAGAFNVRAVDGGFTGLEDGSGFVGGADLSLRVGYGLDGVIGESGDGLIYFSVGYSGDTPSTNEFTETAPAQEGGSLTAAIPARTGFTARIRMPFYLIPGDLLLLSPLYLVSPKTYQGMAVTSVNGGLIPWQLGWATRFGRFQFVLGREVGVTFYGLGSEDLSLLAPGEPPGSGPRVVEFKSTYLEFPILEYRPYRSFDTTQSSALVVKLFGAVDIPNKGQTVFPPGAPGADLDSVYSIGVRIAFDWRRYF